jgi:hypothetical protein
MSSSEKLDRALALLRELGYVAATDEVGINTAGQIIIPINGIPRTHNEIYAMTGMPLEPE